MSTPPIEVEYEARLSELKAAVIGARTRAGLAANAALIMLHWRIGRDILSMQRAEGWGARVIPRLSQDLGKAFGTKGFSQRNLKYMRDFAEAWPDSSILQQAAAKLPWGHHQVLLDRMPRDAPIAFYVERAVEEGWSRNILIHKIETRLHEEAGRSLNNFQATMPAARAAQVNEVFNDRYYLNFVGADDYAHERHLQASLMLRVKELLIELGKGFSFFGENYRLEVGDREFFLDLVFYHTKLHSYVVVDLKMDEFQPEYAGKMAFYLTAVDETLRDRDVDNPSIGLVLCRGRNEVVVNYTLRDVGKPMAVSNYMVLPARYAAMLPSAEILRRHLGPLMPTIPDASSVNHARDGDDEPGSDGGLGGGP